MRANGATMTQGERVAGRGELVAERGVGVEGIAGAEERADIAPEHVVERAGLLDRIRFVGTCHSRSRIETGPAMIVSVNEPKFFHFVGVVTLIWILFSYSPRPSTKPSQDLAPGPATFGGQSTLSEIGNEQV